MNVDCLTRPRPARVLYYGPSLTTGGATVVMRDVAVSLMRRGHLVTVFVEDGRVRCDAVALPEEITVEDAVSRHTWLLRGPWKSVVQPLLVSLSLLRAIAKHGIECVIVDIAHNVARVALLKRWGLIRVPVIARCGTLLTPKIKDAPCPVEAAQRYRHAYAVVDLVVVPTGLAQRDFMNATSLAHPTVIPNGIDTRRLLQHAAECLPQPLPEAEFTICFLGALVASKGLALLIKAVRELHDTHGVRRGTVRVIVIGNGQQRAQLTAAIETLGDADLYSFLGVQANPWQYVAASQCFVACAQYDGFMLSLVEAALLGIPVIYPDAGVGAAELLEECNLGRSYRAGDADSLARALLAELSKPSIPAADAVARLAEMCSMVRLADAYERVVDEVCRKKRRMSVLQLRDRIHDFAIFKH